MFDEASLHKPVLLSEVLDFLDCKTKGCYLDATYGGGGYSNNILKANKENMVVAFDRDRNVLEEAKKMEGKYKGRFKFIQTRFSEIAEVLEKENITGLSGIVFDLGVSSMQLDQVERGFSFQGEAKLSMEMGDNELSAYEVVNNFSEKDLANIIFEFGEERYARRIAAAIVKNREDSPINTTLELATIVSKAKPKFKTKSKIHPATKTFQAIRIYVNNELEELKIALENSYSFLKKGGRIVVVSFHGLEDKIVKSFFKKNSKTSSSTNRYLPEVKEDDAIFKNLTRKAVKPSDKELDFNPRARSAILRAVEKL